MTMRLLLGSVAFLITTSAFAADSSRYSVVRMQMPDQYSVTSVQKAADAAVCRKATADYVKEMKEKCPTCKVLSAGCETSLKGSVAPLMSQRPLKSYSVSAG